MKNQTILACDDNGDFIEYIPRSMGHTGEGRRHLAITVLLINDKNEILLQRRKHQVFDNIWDVTASTHQLHKADGNDETSSEATLRALNEEFGIKNLENLKEVGFINYFAKDGDYCENEHDIILIGNYNGNVSVNNEAMYEYKWVDTQGFLKDIEQYPDKYSPWGKEAVSLLKIKGILK